MILWREEAWRNAERLAAATSEAERSAIAQQIDKAAYAYNGVTSPSSSAARDSYCWAHHDDS